jgi:hypothetical protein
MIKLWVQYNRSFLPRRNKDTKFYEGEVIKNKIHVIQLSNGIGVNCIVSNIHQGHKLCKFRFIVCLIIIY